MAIPCTPTGDKQVQLRRGTTAENNAFTGADGELSFDTDQNRLRVHDGVTPGGFPIAFLSEIVPGSSPPFVDTTNIIMGSVDPTKLLRFEVDGFTTGTVRTLTPQNASYTIAGLETANVFTANQSINGNILLNADGTAAFAFAGAHQFTIGADGTTNIGQGETIIRPGAIDFDFSGGGRIWSFDPDILDFAWKINVDGSAEFARGELLISVAGLVTFPDNVRQIFNPGVTVAGLNVGSFAGDPSTPINGDVWYDSTGNLLRARINGASVSLGAGGASPPFSDSTALVMGSVTPSKLLRFEVDGFTAATTRVLTPQNADYIIAGTNIVNSFTAQQIFDGDAGIVIGTMALTDTGSVGVLEIGNGMVRLLDGALSTSVDTLTDGANIATNAVAANHFRVTLGGNRTLDNPTNPYDGARIVYEFIQDGSGSRTITLDTKFAFGTDITGVTLSTAAGARDFMTVIYNATADLWHVVAFVKGY